MNIVLKVTHQKKHWTVIYRPTIRAKHTNAFAHIVGNHSPPSRTLTAT